MGNDHNAILDKFFKENPDLANPHNQIRQIADWKYDCNFRSQVESGEMEFETALNAARDEAYKILPKQYQQTDHHEAVQDLATSRNQTLPPAHPPAKNTIEQADSDPKAERDRQHAIIVEMAESRSQEPPARSNTTQHVTIGRR